jgi:Flp pilus assembly protein TadG
MFDQLKSTISAHADPLPSLPRKPGKVRVGAMLRRFVCQSDATSALEFGLVAAPFVALTFALVQTGIVFFAGQALQSAAANASRFILTGQAQTQGWTAAQFKTQVCNAISGMFNCQSGVYVDVETYSSFAAANLSMPITNGSFNASGLGYNPGGPGDIVVVRL